MKIFGKIFFLISFIVLVLLDILLCGGVGHGGLLGIDFPGLFAIFGLVGCLLIIVFSKLLGHYWLQRKEDYYRKEKEGEND
ncbi:hypothetical protein ACFLWN_04165 [Chloroflexota bacterium]